MTRRPAPAGWPAMRTPGGGENPLKAALYQRGRLVPWAKGLRDFGNSIKGVLPVGGALVAVIDGIGSGNDAALKREGPAMAQQFDVLFFILTAATPILAIPPLTPAAPIVGAAAGGVKIFNELFKSYLKSIPPRPELLSDAANLAGIQGMPRDTLAAAGPVLSAAAKKGGGRVPTAREAAGLPPKENAGRAALDAALAKKKEIQKRNAIAAAKEKAKAKAKEKALKGGLGAAADDKGGGVPLPLVLAGVGLALKVLS